MGASIWQCSRREGTRISLSGHRGTHVVERGTGKGSVQQVECTHAREDFARLCQSCLTGVCLSVWGGRTLSQGPWRQTDRHARGPREDDRYLFTLNTLQGILFLVAGHTEVLVVLRDEALGANRLLAAMTDEAGLVPAAVLVLHLAGPCHESPEEAAKSRVDNMTGSEPPRSAWETCYHLAL